MTTETSGPTQPVDQKERVKAYWEREACGEIHASAPEGTPEFFAEIERRRDELEPHIARYADFASAAGHDVLEIGVGVGTDFLRFVRAGANAVGVDLTERAVELVSRRLELEGTTAYTKRELGRLFPLSDLRVDKILTAYDRQIAGPLARLSGGLLGWQFVVRGRKP